jgi:hypothetical protein
MPIPVKAAINSAKNSYPTKWPITGNTQEGLIN